MNPESSALKPQIQALTSCPNSLLQSDIQGYQARLAVVARGPRCQDALNCPDTRSPKPCTYPALNVKSNVKMLRRNPVPDTRHSTPGGRKPKPDTATVSGHQYRRVETWRDSRSSRARAARAARMRSTAPPRPPFGTMLAAGASPSSSTTSPPSKMVTSCSDRERGSVACQMLTAYHPGVELRANRKSISLRCCLREVAFEWALTI